jgi:hypothetical protein
MNRIFRKIVIGTLVAALGLASLPLSSAHAAGPNDPPDPGGRSPRRVNARLERAFAHQARKVRHIGGIYERDFTKIQNLIDQASQDGLDVSQLQAALDAYKDALAKNRPLYDQSKSIVDGHDGFDAGGKVTELETARTTVESLHEKLEEFHTAMDGTGKALHEALKAFRQANPRPTATPAP